jgi:hypothetical protein
VLLFHDPATRVVIRIADIAEVAVAEISGESSADFAAAAANCCTELVRAAQSAAKARAVVIALREIGRKTEFSR